MRHTGALVLALWLWSPIASAQSFLAFESEPVRPMALTPDGTRLLVVNTPDNRLAVFDTTGGTLRQVHSIPVGLEPVAVALQSNTVAWVVNHLSDSISIVDLQASPPRVARTLLVGDEPRDIVFAGSGGNRAFVTTAHRGQNTGFDPLLGSPSVPRADVWVFDATNPQNGLGGSALGRLELFGDTPRALAASPDGSSVYAAVFHSGNRTAPINQGVVDFFVGLGTNPLPLTDNVEGEPAPAVGMILKYQGPNNWVDVIGQNWLNAPSHNLPDYDVFKLDANAGTVAAMQSSHTRFSGIGTILFNMLVGPTGKVYVSNTEAHNLTRFEGPGVYAASQGVAPPTTVRGHLHESRITVIDDPNVSAIHLNPHLNYDQVPVPAGTKDKSLAFPLEMALSGDGTTLYVAAFGSRKVGIFDVAELEAGSFVPDAASHVEVGGGPAGLVLNEAANRLYVYTRFNDSVSIVDLERRLEVGRVGLYNPEPSEITDGRRFLYDARISSDRGDSACASCHTFARMDDLAWDLGNPDGAVQPNPNGQVFPVEILADPNFVDPPTLTQEEVAALLQFHPMKGPMTTQTLKGMEPHGPMHWRGDRTGGASDPNEFLNTDLAFKAFNVAFDGLLGGQSLSDPDMQAYTDFVLELVLPPNPIRNLDNTLTASQQAGSDFWFDQATDGVLTCNDCHVLDPGIQAFGTDGLTSFEGEAQLFKVPHMRNMYQKVGKFGLLGVSGSAGDQIRGSGYLHDGSVDTLLSFVSAGAFEFPGGNPQRGQVIDFMLAFDTGVAPIVGQGVTRHAGNSADPEVSARIALLKERAGLTTPESDLVVRGVVAGEPRSWVMTAPDTFTSDRAADTDVDEAGLLALAGGDELTFLAVPPGSGTRIGIDADTDTVRDGDDNCEVFANLGQADTDSDGTGNDCECADEDGDGTITSGDLGALADCLDGSSACTGLCDGTHDDQCNASDVTAVQLALNVTGQLRCARNPLP